MNKRKLIIIILILIIILTITVVLILRQIEKLNTSDYNSNTEFEQQVIYTTNTKLEEEKNRNKYYAVEEIVNKYMRSISNLQREDIEDSNQALYAILDEQYKTEFNVSLDNVKEKFNMYTYNEKIYIDKMYEAEKSASINVFLIYGTTINSQEQTELMVKTDSSNYTFSVFPSDFIQKYGYSIDNNIESMNISDTEIEKNNYNTFEYTNINNEQMAIYYFADIKNRVYEGDALYNLLDSQYKEKKFSNMDEYNTYLNKMKDYIINRNIVNYKINNYDGYTQFILIDQEGSYYIVNETAVMEYTLILDTYTIDLPEFVEDYNNSSDSEKVLLNIQKVFSAIKDEDYRYVYNKLDATFRQNNFQTLESFITYINNNFYKNSSIGYSEYQTSGNLHIYKITIENADDETSRKVEKNFIMQLLEGTDFVMSFNV